MDRTLQELDRKRAEIEQAQKEIERQRAKATQPVQRMSQGGIVALTVGGLFLLIGIAVFFTIKARQMLKPSKQIKA